MVTNATGQECFSKNVHKSTMAQEWQNRLVLMVTKNDIFNNLLFTCFGEIRFREIRQSKCLDFNFGLSNKDKFDT